jgi:hypothetical protein
MDANVVLAVLEEDFAQFDPEFTNCNHIHHLELV